MKDDERCIAWSAERHPFKKLECVTSMNRRWVVAGYPESSA